MILSPSKRIQMDHPAHYVSWLAADAKRYDYFNNHWSKQMKIPIIGIAMLTLASCSATHLYEGPRLAETEVVRINGIRNSESPGYRVVVCQIDGQNLSPCKSDIEVLPGEHTLKLELVYSGFTRQTSYHKKLFKAGDKYLMSPGKLVGGSQPRLKFWRDKNINE